MPRTSSHSSRPPRAAPRPGPHPPGAPPRPPPAALSLPRLLPAAPDRGSAAWRGSAPGRPPRGRGLPWTAFRGLVPLGLAAWGTPIGPPMDSDSRYARPARPAHRAKRGSRSVMTPGFDVTHENGGMGALPWVVVHLLLTLAGHAPGTHDPRPVPGRAEATVVLLVSLHAG
ncbi:hypothetical protein GCM10010381_12540 [Streptomyces xantholiticus]|nr:hypothetical protein GCM10010381_12540 [Streptomyces xantholiticus]